MPYNHEYYLRNRERKIEQSRQYHERNREIVQEKARVYYLQNKERLLANHRLYVERNKEKASTYVAKSYAENPKKRLLRNAKQRAEKLNLEFYITADDIVLPEKCPYLGISLTTIQGNGRRGSRIKSNLSLDRIDNKKGYIPGNIMVISDLANRMKTNATKEELQAFARGIQCMYTEI
jgi:hypothetical protein